MNKIPLYHADVFSNSNVGTDEQYANLLAQILEGHKTLPATERSNDGCWRTNTWWTGVEWLGEQLCDLVDEACRHYATLDPTFAQYIGRYNFAANTNVNEPGSRNLFHSHKTAIFSAVYYLQADDTGPLRLVNPANTIADCNYAAPFVRDFYFNPKDRDLIVWPAWVPHEVEPNKSTKQRININFDIYFAG